MRKIIVGVFTFFAIFSSMNLFADEGSETNSVPQANSGSSEQLSKKIDRVLDSQAQIIKELEDLKAELQIVKIRVTQKS